jgi:hypothetical protein
VKRKIVNEWKSDGGGGCTRERPPCNGGKEIEDTHSMIRAKCGEKRKGLQLNWPVM